MQVIFLNMTKMRRGEKYFKEFIYFKNVITSIEVGMTYNKFQMIKLHNMINVDNGINL